MMDSQWHIYQVFEQERADLPHRNAGSVHAPDAEMAMENARDVFARRPNCTSMWVVPERAIFPKTVQELQTAPLARADSPSARVDLQSTPLARADSPSARVDPSPARVDLQSTPSTPETYLVFQKQGQTARETFVAHVGDVSASSPHHALSLALEKFSGKNVFVWWIVPERAIIKSESTDAPSMFDPAHTKKYRNHLSYPVEPIMRQLKSAREILENDGGQMTGDE